MLCELLIDLAWTIFVVALTGGWLVGAKPYLEEYPSNIWLVFALTGVALMVSVFWIRSSSIEVFQHSKMLRNNDPSVRLKYTNDSLKLKIIWASLLFKFANKPVATLISILVALIPLLAGTVIAAVVLPAAIGSSAGGAASVLSIVVAFTAAIIGLLSFSVISLASMLAEFCAAYERCTEDNNQ